MQTNESKTASDDAPAQPTSDPGDRNRPKGDSAPPPKGLAEMVKEFTPLVLVVLACVLMFEGILLKYFVTADWLDRQLGLTEHVKRQLAKAVDSGYSGT